MESLHLSYELDTLSDIIEERKRLLTILKIEPSTNDNIILKKQINKVLDSLNEASNELDFQSLGEYSQRYNDILTDIPANDTTIDVKLYQFEIPQRKSVATSIIDGSSMTSGNSSSIKKVRFRDENLVSYEDEFSPAFMPYKDEPEIENIGNRDEIEQERQKLFDSSNALEQTATIITPQVSNQDIFIQQQQQLLEQDSQLERLSGSIRTTHGISLNINYEINEQNDQVLDDLESLLDNNGRNLDRAKRKLRSFEKNAKENGPCFIIVILIVVLILLLAVL